MPKQFQPSRADGRTDAEVVYDLVEKATPNDEFPYEAIIEVLQDGVDYPITRKHVHNSVRRANVLLLESRSRSLQVVRNMGYRVIRAQEHMQYAKRHEKRAERQVSSALRLIKHTKMSELPEASRRLHEQQYIALDGLHSMFRATNRRQERTEQQFESLAQEQHANNTATQMILNRLMNRIERIEQNLKGE